MHKNIKKKRLTKRTYVYLGLVTMAAVSLFAKPIKRGFSALEKRLKSATGKKSLRHNLGLFSQNNPHPTPFLKSKKFDK